MNKGLWYAISGASLWGLSGAMAQFVMTNGVTPVWLVGIRLLGAGILLMAWCFAVARQDIWRIWREKWSRWQLLIFTFLGVTASQLTYFLAVYYSNAATATVLQFLAPLMIMVYLAVRFWQLPRRIDTIALVLALIGVVLVATKGQLTSFAISPLALMWALLAALSGAVITLMPRRLMHEFDARVVTGWTMLLGGLTFLPYLLTTPVPVLNAGKMTGIGLIVVGGTLMSYLFYLASLRYLEPATAGMLGAFEPLVATLIAVVFLHTAFGLPEIIGGLCVVGTTFLQAWAERKTHALR